MFDLKFLLLGVLIVFLPGLAGLILNGMSREPEPQLPEVAHTSGASPVPPDGDGSDEPSDRFIAFLSWLQKNWMFLLSATSLSLAGIYLVRYEIENGWFPPSARVAAGILFGGLLIAAGDWLWRRGGGDGEKARFLHLPSVFSSAGIVSIYGAVVGGRLAWELYDPEMAFVALVATTIGSVMLGWRHGPLLVSVGLVGAGAAPLLIGGGTASWLLYLHYVLIAVLGLSVDALRKWRWVSVLALVTATGGAWLAWTGGAGEAGWLVSLCALVAVSVWLPAARWLPEHQGPSAIEAMRTAGQSVSFPVVLALGMVVTACLSLLSLESLAPSLAATGLVLLLVLGGWRSPALGDLAILPAATLVLSVAGVGETVSGVAPEPQANTLIVVLSMAASALLALRARDALLRPLALAACLTAPLVVAALEMRWNADEVLGILPWSIHILAVAGLMAGTAALWNGLEDRLPKVLAALCSLFLLTFAASLTFGQSALTLAFAGLLVAAAELDRRKDVPHLDWFIQAVIAILTWRLVLDPGVHWTLEGPVALVLPAWVCPIAAAIAAARMMPRTRTAARGVADSAALIWSVLLADLMIWRALDAAHLMTDPLTHWFLALVALPLLFAAGIDLWRAERDPALAGLRRAMAIVTGGVATGCLMAIATFANPFFTGDAVHGQPVFDTLLLAYAAPAVLLLAGGRFLNLGMARPFVQAVGLGMTGLWMLLEIRCLWQGPFIDGPGVLPGELASYTAALLALGGLLIGQAVRLRSELLRRLAMTVIVLTVSKVFLWDAADLVGLLRVLSFLLLGLSLAGMAWLNEKVKRGIAEDEAQR
ncbi:DUF2339 domain-containing protein [Cereibacter sphaeroides]|uniref:DUF2339 domain-containing protein n=1 Tax=Cereibacter sphaeroides TaxID=1063 RepID=UPI001F4077AA|nr:DUF2339 domain-containing protein [Cereibacter sphaeroides]MCE6958323.1 DUF2339 domain-containing protein [Cereibacter sphaeroides]MCE6971933.1 DUF2339 domain-containing protein [Cereibacter sphaeroides]